MKNQVNLTEYLHDEMDLFFVALNAPEESNNNGHWFSRNLSFWNVLYDSGIITSSVFDPLMGDVIVFGTNAINFNKMIIGVTDLNRTDVQINSKDVKTNLEQVRRIIEILDAKKVKRLVLMHSKVATEFEEANLITRNFKNGVNIYGKVGQYKATEIFQVPFHNASIPDKAAFYRMLIDNTVSENAKVSKAANFPPVSIVKSTETSFAKVSFTFPDEGNSITEKDIEKATLRVTVAFKAYFPPTDSQIDIVFKDTTYHVKYVKRGSRSDLLKLGKDLMSKFGLRVPFRVKFTKLGMNKFEISKA